MEYFKSSESGRTFIVRLSRNDLLRESIVELAKRENICNAVIVSGIATLDVVNIQMAISTDYPIRFHTDHITEPVEMASLDGTIINGEPHLHCVLGNASRSWAGHMADGCRILYLAEIVVQEIVGNDLIRKEHEESVFLISKKD